MGWFEEQIELRKKSDNQIFEDSFLQLADAITGKRLFGSEDDRKHAEGVLGDILGYYKCKSVEIPENVTEFEDGLEYACRMSGLMYRYVNTEKGWHKDAFGAMLAFRKDDGKAVALLPNAMDIYKYVDIYTGKRCTLNAKSEELFEKEAICFYRPLPMRKIGLMDLFRFSLQTLTLRDVIAPIAVMGITTLIGMLIPYISRFLIGTVAESREISLLVSTVLFMICVGISRILMGAVGNVLSTRMSMKMGICVEAAAIMRVVSLPAYFFKDHSSGELATCTGYIRRLCDSLVSVLFETSVTAILSLIYVVQIQRFAPSLVGTAMVVILATVVVSVLATLARMKVNTEVMKTSTKESGMSYAMVSGIEKIRLAGAEKRAFARWADIYSKRASLMYNPPVFVKINGVIITAISLIGTIVMYAKAIKTGISVADYYVFNSAFGMVMGAFMSVVGIVSAVAEIRPMLKIIQPILDAEPEASVDKKSITNLRGGIECDNLCFRYSDDMPPIFDGFNLKITPGQYVAIVGKTGCGKSTLIKLLLGFEKPQKGTIMFDNNNIDDVDMRSLRRRIGTVLQSGRLFMGDIYSNIAFSSNKLTLDEAWEAAEIAGIAEDIRNMPMGMFTYISEEGGGISGGQRQRILIARAIAPKPRILIFDEATSALDNITQKRISEALDAMKCTRIVIAHRLSTIKNCDRIVMISDGRIIEDGTYDELMELNGEFAEMVSRQVLSATAPEPHRTQPD